MKPTYTDIHHDIIYMLNNEQWISIRTVNWERISDIVNDPKAGGSGNKVKDTLKMLNSHLQYLHS